MTDHVILLGPQRRITMREAALRLAPDGPVATITAGWQEREPDDEELDQHLDGRSVNLALYRRGHAVMQRDRELAELHRCMKIELEEIQRLYELRLTYAMDAWIELMERKRTPKNGNELIARECREAAAAVRRLDAGHLRKVAAVHRDFEERTGLAARPSVAVERQEIAAVLEKATMVVVAGGHVGTLLDRLRLFGVESLIRGKPILAWSAGAMALAPIVVLFHDRPPQGPGHAQAFDGGLRLYPNVVPLPHGSRRLRLEDTSRVQRFVQRFGSRRTCVLLDPGAELEWNGSQWHSKAAAQLSRRGTTREVGSW